MVTIPVGGVGAAGWEWDDRVGGLGGGCAEMGGFGVDVVGDGGGSGWWER